MKIFTALFWLSFLIFETIEASTCLKKFASLSESEQFNPIEIQNTYQSILRNIGDEVAPEVWEQMLKAENPFELPQDLHSESLQDTLTHFEEILRKTPGDFDRIRTNLLRILSNHRQKIETIDRKQEAVSVQSHIAVIPWRHGQDLQMKVVGNTENIIGLDGKGQLSYSFSGRPAVNIQINKTIFKRFGITKTDSMEQFVLSPDGKEMYFYYSMKPFLFKARLLNEKNEMKLEVVPELLRELDEPITQLKISSTGNHLLARMEYRFDRISVINPLSTKDADHSTILDDLRFVDFDTSGTQVITVSGTHIRKLDLKLRNVQKTKKISIEILHSGLDSARFSPYQNRTSIHPNGEELISSDWVAENIKSFPLKLNFRTGKRGYFEPKVTLPPNFGTRNIRNIQISQDGRYLLAVYSFVGKQGSSFQSIRGPFVDTDHLLAYDLKKEFGVFYDLKSKDVTGLMYDTLRDVFYISDSKSGTVRGIPRVMILD